jgi:hypothetical protein
MLANARPDFCNDGILQLVLRLKKSVIVLGGVSTDNVNLLKHMSHIYYRNEFSLNFYGTLPVKFSG